MIATAYAADPQANTAQNAEREAIRRFFQNPERALETLGAQTSTGRATLTALDDISKSTQAITQFNHQLIPLIEKFRTPDKRTHFWRRFTGSALEHEVLFASMCAEVEAIAELAIHEVESLTKHIEQLEREGHLIERDMRTINHAINLGHQVASDRYKPLRVASRCNEDFVDRLLRRLANLEMMANSLKLSNAQFAVAADHSRSVILRFKDIHTLLMPIWYQRMGFELFSRRVSQKDDA
jgi:hypothetical protein